MQTVKDLIARLQKMPEDAVVWVKSDPEGNQTRWLDNAYTCTAVKGAWGWYEGEDDAEGGIPAVVIWPDYGEPFDE